jgi:hypothetical protein
MTPTHTAGLPHLVTLRIGDVAAYRTGEEAADATYRKTAPKKGTSGPVTGSKASEVPQFYCKNQYCKKTYNPVGPPLGQ